MVRLRKRTVRKLYGRKAIYTYKRFFLEFPARFNDLVEDFFGSNLTISVQRCAERLIVTLLAPAKAFLSSESLPRKEERRSFT